ncbi:UV radiation resistance protein and autophagy-related subunit 14-domain-containing protein [Mycotypha africana]|uniref:UV radiation resistance protein and autophagy-related subunit 14-domain-containing protein n=1 Tax=Mycotypha africana TaxID=64632 RepID=UPI0023010B72|nr:UV radiation resistance protein and autophagy-related subunit 14-domain-containing protein [Mycotypha africana]KAI8979721.1 UV radiation resistance protein and autophagy-related subunit 14-domain-containing protein [Mycotypha africana]
MTLHVSIHNTDDNDEGNIIPEFYKSEVTPNTVNPTFRSLPCSFDWMNWYDAASSLLIVRIYARHATPETAGQYSEPVLGYQYQKDVHNISTESPVDTLHFQLLLEWQLDLNALSKIGNSNSDLHFSFPKNTLIFELDDGFYTAPVIKTLIMNQSQRTSMLELDNLNQDNVSIRSGSSISRSKRSYTYNSLMKLNTLMECIFDTRKSADEIRESIQEILTEEERGFKLKRELSERRTELVEKEARIMKQKKALKAKIQTLQSQKERLANFEMKLADSYKRCIINSEELQENECILEENSKMRQNVFRLLNRRKKELIADLFSIYPIEQKKSFDDSQQFSIRGLNLPNSVFDGQDEERIATALGFTAHLVSMLAYYLEIPLRYPIKPMGSRASITDPVSLITGSREFPLYSKRVDKYRFEFGVFLLNKDIEQMMNAYGLIVMDLRHTLPNIHYFIQAILTTSVTSKPTSMSVLSISSYANGTGRDQWDEHNHPIRRDHNHLTLQPTSTNNNQPPPSPSISTHSVSTTIATHSPKSIINFPSPLLNTSQTTSAPIAFLDMVTTSSSTHYHSSVMSTSSSAIKLKNKQQQHQ